jgi:hypothetical protein
LVTQSVCKTERGNATTVSALGVVLVVDVFVFGVIGWRADRLARDPAQRAGLAWGAVVFLAPFAVWLAVALSYAAASRETDWGPSAVFGLGYLVSVAAVLVGQAAGRAAHLLRDRR